MNASAKNLTMVEIKFVVKGHMVNAFVDDPEGRDGPSVIGSLLARLYFEYPAIREQFEKLMGESLVEIVKALYGEESEPYAFSVPAKPS